MGLPRAIQDTQPRQRFASAGYVALVATVTLIAIAWGPTFVRMWGRWFPVWSASDITGLGRFTAGSSYYTHAPLVPAVSLILAIGVYRRCGFPIRRSRRAAMIGWGVFIFCSIAHLLSVYVRVMFVSGFALVGIIAGILLICGGRPTLRAYAAPLALMLFMVPLPMHWIAGLNFTLKTYAGHAAMWLTTELCGIAAIMDGSYVHLSDGTGGVRVLVIDDLCSGLRSLIGLLWFASLYAVLGRSRRWRQVALIAAAVPVAIGCNILRITVLNIGAARFSVACAATGGWLHEITGLSMFGLAIAFQYGLDRFLSPRVHTTPVARSQSERRDRRRPAAALPAGFLPTVAVLLIVAAVSLFWAQPAAASARRLARRAAPLVLSLDGRVFRGIDHTLDPRTLAILETDDYLYRTYAAGPTGPEVSVLIVHSGHSRKGTHPPEVCLTGSGHRIVSKAVRPVAGNVPAMQELVTDRAGRRAVHLYLYKCGGRYTRSFTSQQAMIVANGMLGRDAGAALVRLTVPVVGTDEDSARQLALAAARQILPAMTTGLP